MTLALVLQPPLELGHPSLESLVCLHQPPVRLDQLAEPKQQTDSRPTITLEKRLRLDRSIPPSTQHSGSLHQT
jgi:hypothetical protein